MILAILIGVAVALLALVGYIASRPDTFEISRSAVMAASPHAVFDQVNDFHRWPAWSPWAKLDPNLKEEYSGPDSGVGASYHWVGNKKVGEGRMTIVESQPDRTVKIDLQFIAPFACRNVAQFTFEPAGVGTRITWSMSGRSSFLFKAMGLFCSMDKMVGKDFEKGLAAMTAVVEGTPARSAAATPEAAPSATV